MNYVSIWSIDQKKQEKEKEKKRKNKLRRRLYKKAYEHTSIKGSITLALTLTPMHTQISIKPLIDFRFRRKKKQQTNRGSREKTKKIKHKHPACCVNMLKNAIANLVVVHLTNNGRNVYSNIKVRKNIFVKMWVNTKLVNSLTEAIYIYKCTPHICITLYVLSL